MLVRKSALTGGFSDGGKLTAPVEFLVAGDMPSCIEAFKTQAIPIVIMALNRIALRPE